MTAGRRACRSGQPCQPRTLSEVIYCVVHHSDVDAGTLAEFIGVRRGYLIDAANADRDEVQFQLRWLIPVTLRSGNDALMRYLARGCGGAFVVLPLGQAGPSDATAHAATICREVADVLDTPATILARRGVPPNDVSLIEKEISEAIEALVNYQQHVRGGVSS